MSAPAARGESDFLAVSRRLLDVLGADGLGSEWEQRDLAVDGVEPRWVALPENEAQCAALLRIACEEGLAVVPAGKGARLGQGRAAARLDLVLSLERMTATVEHADADLTLTIEAGATLAEVADRLRPAGQWLPLDPSFPERTTIGGLLAANASGPARLRHGTIRESLLGLRAVLADGTVVKSGGRVVKNVAGYDVHRLLVGSFGTLAVVTQASLRLQPLAERVRGLTFSSAAPLRLYDAAAGVARSPVAPRSVDVVQAPGERPRALVVLAGFEEDVDEGARRTRERFAAAGATEEDDAGPGAATKALADVESTAPGSDVVLRLGGPPAVLGEWTSRALERAARAADRVRAHAHAAVGVARLRLEGARRDGTASLVAELRRDAVRARGYLVAESLPPAWKTAIDPWGSPPGGRDLAAGIKRAFDPRGILSPGRFVEGS